MCEKDMRNKLEHPITKYFYTKTLHVTRWLREVNDKESPDGLKIETEERGEIQDSFKYIILYSTTKLASQLGFTLVSKANIDNIWKSLGDGRLQ